MWLHDLGEAPFTREERKFLSRAGRARVSLEALLERVQAIVGSERPSRGRQKYLASRLFEQALFLSLEEALAFSESYYALIKQGPLSPRLLWDWE